MQEEEVNKIKRFQQNRTTFPVIIHFCQASNFGMLFNYWYFFFILPHLTLLTFSIPSKIHTHKCISKARDINNTFHSHNYCKKINNK